MLKLYTHQQTLLDKNPHKHLVAWGCGTGKTAMSLALARKNGVKALIIVPKALKANWERQAPDHHIITKETFRRDAHKLPPFEAVIVDECHAFSSMTSQMSKALVAYIKLHSPKFVWLLSATPLTSTPWSIYRLAQFLGHQWNYQSFRHKFFFDMRMGHRTVPAPRKGMDKELAALIHSIGDVVTLDQCADVPDQVFETEYFALTPDQVRGLNALDDATHIARFTKHHQVEQGCKKSDGYEPDLTIACLKNDRIIELCRENPKVLVFARYHLQINILKELIEKELKCPVFILTGETKDRDAVVQQVERTPRCVLLAQSDTAEGWETPSIPLVIFASLSFSYLRYTQALGRVHRINALKKNVFIHLITEGGPDEAIFEAIQRKEDFYVELYKGVV